MKLLLSLLLVFATLNCFAQKQNVYFVKNDGSFVQTKDSADFVRIVAEPDSGTKLYNVNELYKNGKRKLVGKSSTIGYPFFDGQTIEFFENGKRKRIRTYDKGQLTGSEYNYFLNGKPYITKQHNGKRDTAGNYIYTIVANSDSLGNVLVSEGTGHFKGYDESFEIITEDGEVKDGKKDGVWKGKEGNISYIENYKKGALITGTSTDSLGETRNYTLRETLPHFPGGPNTLANFLGRYLRYPAADREKNIQGKVIVHFNVKKDGSIIDVVSFDYPTPLMAKEATRVIAGSPKWEPATKLGWAREFINYTLPISFTLSGD